MLANQLVMNGKVDELVLIDEKINYYCDPEADFK